MTLHRRHHHLAAALACLAAGLALGWLSGWARPDEDPARSNNPADAARDHRRAANDGEGGQRRDFASYLKRVESWSSHPDLIAAMERMSRDELLAVLAEAPEPDLHRGTTRTEYLWRKVHSCAAAELIRREGAAAIDWAQSGNHRGAWAALLGALAEVDPAAASERERAYGSDAAARYPLYLGQHAVMGAVTRSAADVIACLKLWPNAGFENISEYAPGFDFGAVLGELAKLQQTIEFGQTAKHLLAAWAAAEPEAAAAALARGMKEGGATAQTPAHDWSASFGPALEARALMGGEDAAGAWMAGILAEIPGDCPQRAEALAGLVDKDLSTARAQALIDHLPDEDRIALAVAAEENHGARADHRPALRLLQAMPTGNLQMQALQAIAEKTVRDRPPDLRAGGLKDLESLMGQLQLSEAAMQKVFESAAGE